MEMIALGGAAEQWPTAATLLSHRLDGSGDTQHVNPEEIMNRSPEMRREIAKTLAEHPGNGTIDSVQQPDISHLNTVGLARDFDVHGSSEHRR